MNYEEYFDALRGKRAAVIGIGVSNRPLIEILLSHGVFVTACDRKDRKALGSFAEHLEALGCRLQLGEGYLEGLDQDVIFRTPGMRPDLPQLQKAIDAGSRLTSEMEAFFEVCPCPMIAVTGSDGKTTTSSIIAEMLRKAGKTVYLGGNIGHPLLAEAKNMREDDLVVLELSSFQLLTMEKSPHIAVMTNLAPNHLDVHKDFAEYISAKENNFTHQSAEDIAVFNYDNAITREQSSRAKGAVRLFSRREELKEGVFLRGDAIICRKNGAEREVMKVSDIRLPGVHNIENYMAAIAAVDGLADDDAIRAVAREFNGVEHRIELVRTLRGVRYYNDSIATSPDRTIAGLNSFDQKVILIAGGKNKGIPYDTLGPAINDHVKLLLLCGDTADVIRASTEQADNYGGLPIRDTADLQEALAIAKAYAVDGDIVLLSPASTAFDRYANFMERGKVFKEIVNRLN